MIITKTALRISLVQDIMVPTEWYTVQSRLMTLRVHDRNLGAERAREERAVNRLLRRWGLTAAVITRGAELLYGERYPWRLHMRLRVIPTASRAPSSWLFDAMPGERWCKPVLRPLEAKP